MLVATFQNSCKSTKIIKKMKKANITKSVLAGLFSTVTIGMLTLLTYKTEFGVFLIASFGSSMVLLFGYPESPFAQPKNIFFWALINFNDWYYISIFGASANFFANSTGCRFWCCFNDIVECNSSTRRWKSYYRYNGQCIVGLFSKSNNNWFINNISFWSNFKSTYIKKEISFINGHKVQRHKT